MTEAKVSKAFLSQSDELEDRLIEFAVRIINLSPAYLVRQPVSTSQDRFFDPEPLQLRTTEKHEAPRVERILFTSCE